MAPLRSSVTIIGTELSDSAAAWSSPSPTSRQAALLRLSGTFWERSAVAVLVYQSFVGLGYGLGRIGISANALTYASLAFAGLSCIAAASGYFLLAAAAALIGGVCDALDGVVARSTGTVSRFGALLDSTVDRVSDALPLLGVVVFHAHWPLLALVPGFALIGAVVIPYARARAEALGVKLPSLFMRRPERVVLTLLALSLGGVHVEHGTVAPVLLAMTGLLAVLNTVGGVLVLRAAQKALDPVQPATSRTQHRI
jgi:CDP-diacylglycerol--glycerol-3-phosphate 3-phosphatidyltransferase